MCTKKMYKHNDMKINFELKENVLFASIVGSPINENI